MNQYKAALIGCGNRGNGNARMIAESDRMQMAALVDPNEEAAERIRSEHGFDGAATYTDHRQMLAEQQPDFCAICVWTPLHLDVFRDVAEAGVKAVFMEKPIAGTWADSREIARIADRTGCSLSFSHQRRFNRGNEIARKLIADGTFGDLIRMDLYSPKGLLDCGTHTLDQAFSYLGDRVGVKWVHGAIDVSDTIEAFGIRDGIMFSGTLMYDNGILANMYCSMPDADHWTGVKVFGTKGFMEFDWGGAVNKYAVYDQPHFTPPDAEEADRADPMRKSYQDLIQAMDSGEENQLHYRKALRATEVIFALYESIRSHRRVELPLTDVDGHPLEEMLEARARPAS